MTIKVSPIICGEVDAGFELVRNAFERNFAMRSELGASGAACRVSHKVVDLWADVQDERMGKVFL